MSDQTQAPAQPSAAATPFSSFISTVGPKIQNTGLTAGASAVVTDTLEWIIDGITGGWKPPSHELVSGWAVGIIMLVHWAQKRFFPSAIANVQQ